MLFPPTKKSRISLIPNDNAALDTTGCLVDNAPLNPVEVVEVAPMVKDDNNIIIFGSSYSSTSKPLTPFVELNPVANKIAHRELKVKIGDVLC